MGARERGKEVGKCHGYKGKGPILTTLVPGQRQVPNKQSFLVPKLRMSRENGIFQNNVQGGDSPAVVEYL